MSWTTPKTWSAGSALPAADLNTYVRDNTEYIKDSLETHGITSDATPQPLKSGGYGCSLKTSGTVNLGDASDVQVQFDDEEWDDAGFHSTVTNTARITIPTGGGGRYLFNGHVSFAANSTGRRELWFEVNGADEYNRVRHQPVSSVATAIQTVLELELVAGDYVVLRARQNSGETLTASARLQARRTSV
jgi:hypothetical protein